MLRPLPAAPGPGRLGPAARSGSRSSRRRATIYVWAPVPERPHAPRRSPKRCSSEPAVVVSPGTSYGPSGEGFFRISLTIADERLLEAVERMRGEPRRLGQSLSLERRLTTTSRISSGTNQASRPLAAVRATRPPTARASSTRGRASAPSASGCCRPAAAGEHDELAELKELLRTAGVAVAGELVQRRPRPTPTTISARGRSRS